MYANSKIYSLLIVVLVVACSSSLMNMQQLVIPAKAGIQNSGNPLKILDSRFYWNDEIMPFSSCYESINIELIRESLSV